jgi:galactonate dehydratase
LIGVGEAAVAYGVGATAAAGMVKDLVETMVLGRDPLRIEELWTQMYDHTFWAKGGGGAILFAGISAIEQALWDIKGKALGIPVYEMLGGAMRDQVRLYANGWSYKCLTPDDYARAAERPIADGYTALKCYPLAVPNERGGIRHVSRRSVDRSFADLAFKKVRAIREAFGSEIDIMADLSGGLTTDETIRLCRRLEELELLFVEEPVDP